MIASLAQHLNGVEYAILCLVLFWLMIGILRIGSMLSDIRDIHKEANNLKREENELRRKAHEVLFQRRKSDRRNQFE